MKHTISILVNNHAGVLSRVSGLFSRRGFNISSLAVGETDDPALSRITIVLDGDEYAGGQITKQLGKLIDVVTVKVLKDEDSVSRELVLLKVKALKEKRAEIIQIVDIFRAKIIDVSPDCLTIEITGETAKVEALSKMLFEFGILEIARTGIISLERGDETINNYIYHIK